MKMNCLAFRRLCLTDPESKDAEYLAHKKSCADCQKFYKEMVQFDQQIVEAMSVPVPSSLEADILLRQSIRQFNHRRVWVSGSIAAMILVAVMAVGWYSFPHQQSNLGQSLVVHVQHEPMVILPPEQLTHSVTQGDIQKLLKTMPFRLNGELSHVVSARFCDVQDKIAAHLVVSTKHGRVDVFLMPDQPFDEPSVFAHDGMQGRLLAYEDASVAVLGQSMSGVKVVETELLAALDQV